MGNLVAFSVREVKRAAAANEKGKRRVFLCKKTVRVKAKSKVVPMSFLKIEGRGMVVEVKDQKEKDS